MIQLPYASRALPLGSHGNFAFMFPSAPWSPLGPDPFHPLVPSTLWALVALSHGWDAPANSPMWTGSVGFSGALYSARIPAPGKDKPGKPRQTWMQMAKLTFKNV